MASDFDSQMKARIQAFTEELTSLVRDAAMATLRDALGEQQPRRGRRTLPPTVVAALPFSGKRLAGGTRIKRGPEELDELRANLFEYISQHAGQRIEAISAGMGVPTKELNLPVKKLLADKQIKTKGHKRATEYYPQ